MHAGGEYDLDLVVANIGVAKFSQYYLKYLRQGVIDGNKDDMKMAAHMMGYVPIPGGPNINVTTNIANSNQVSGGTYDRSIDSIIRKLDAQAQEVVDVTPR